MRFDELVENRILEAIEEGVFEGLRGVGAPLPRRSADQLAGELWLGHHLLGNAGAPPEWLELAREIERDKERLAKTADTHGALVHGAKASGDWRRFAPLIAARRREFADAVRRLRAKQDRYNFEAPGMLSQRPGIWVEERLRHLDVRVRDAHRRPSAQREAR